MEFLQQTNNEPYKILYIFNLKFNYVDDSNEIIEHKFSRINFKTKTLIVRGAKLDHFSRYGRTRTGS